MANHNDTADPFVVRRLADNQGLLNRLNDENASLKDREAAYQQLVERAQTLDDERHVIHTNQGPVELGASPRARAQAQSRLDQRPPTTTDNKAAAVEAPEAAHRKPVGEARVDEDHPLIGENARVEVRLPESLRAREALGEPADQARAVQDKTPSAEQEGAAAASQAADDAKVVGRRPPGARIERVGEPLEERITALDKTVSRKFVADAKGRYRWREHPDVIAFREKSASMTTASESPMVAKAMVAVAESKGWGELRAKGTAQFRREVWLEGNLRGIQVQGYEPSEQDKQALEDRLNTLERVDKRSDARKRETASDNTQHKQARLAESLTAAFRDLSKKEAVTQYPQLDKLYGLDKTARAFADSRIANAPSRAAFVEQIRARAIGELAKGRPIPEVEPVQKDRVRQRETVAER